MLDIKPKQLAASLILLFAIICMIWVINSIILMLFMPFTKIGKVKIAAVALLVAVIEALCSTFIMQIDHLIKRVISR
jgi:hypothetical protein